MNEAAPVSEDPRPKAGHDCQPYQEGVYNRTNARPLPAPREIVGRRRLLSQVLWEGELVNELPAITSGDILPHATHALPR